MSWQATAAVGSLTEGVTRSEKLVLLCLANRHNNDLGYAWLSVPNLAKEAIMCERTVQRMLRSLVTKGLLTAIPRPGESTLYTIPLIDGGAKMTPPLRQNVTGDKMSGVTSNVGGGVTSGVTQTVLNGHREIEKLHVRANLVATLETTPKEEQEPLVPTFARRYAREVELKTARCPSPAAQGAAFALAREFGDAECIQVAEDYGWPHPSYLRQVLMEPKENHERKPVGRNAVAAPQVGDALAIYASMGIRAEDLPIRLPVRRGEASGLAALDGHDDP